jgi:hypothetical protein
MEIDQLDSEIEAISNRVEFNNIPLLNIPEENQTIYETTTVIDKVWIGTETKIVTRPVEKEKLVLVDTPVTQIGPRTVVQIGWIDVEEGDDFSVYVNNFSAIDSG